MANNMTYARTPRTMSTLSWMLLTAVALLIGHGARAEPLGSTRPGWLQLDSVELDFVFTRRDTDLAGYDRVIVDLVSVWYVNDYGLAQDERDAQIARLQAGFTEASAKALESIGFQIVDEPGPGVLRLHVEIIDLKINQPIANQNPFKDRFLFDVEPGHMTLVAQLQDSISNEILMYVADMENTIDEAELGSLWDQVELAFGNWSTTLSYTVGGSTLANPVRVVRGND